MWDTQYRMQWYTCIHKSAAIHDPWSSTNSPRYQKSFLSFLGWCRCFARTPSHDVSAENVRQFSAFVLSAEDVRDGGFGCLECGKIWKICRQMWKNIGQFWENLGQCKNWGYGPSNFGVHVQPPFVTGFSASNASTSRTVSGGFLVKAISCTQQGLTLRNYSTILQYSIILLLVGPHQRNITTHHPSDELPPARKNVQKKVL